MTVAPNRRVFRVTVFVMLCLRCLVGAMPAAAVATDSFSDPAQLGQRIAGLNVPFIPNTGQWDAGITFAAQTFAGTFLISAGGQLIYSLPGAAPHASMRDRQAVRNAIQEERLREPAPAPARLLTETMVDADGRALPLSPHGVDPHTARVSYFVGAEESRYRRSLPTYERVSLGELAPGIAVDLRATGRNVEKIFRVAPVADPQTIRVRLGGADRIELRPDGELVAHTGGGSVVYSAPIAFQENDAGQKSPVPVRYALLADRLTYGFAVGDYDHSRPLVIDPFLQASYLGGAGIDSLWAIAVHPASGEVLVAGRTNSTALPCTAAAQGCADGAQPAHFPDAGNNDAMVARFSADLTSLLQVTFLGGGGDDGAWAITVHPVSGEVLVAGYTYSTDFPCTTVASGCANGAQAAHGADFSNSDGFVARLNASLTSLLQATYLGASSQFPGSYGEDTINAITVHPASGEVLVAGYTGSNAFPCTTTATPGCSNGAQPAAGGASGYYHGFIARLNGSLTKLLQATYLGGSLTQYMKAIAVHPVTGEIVVAGSSNSLDFPCVSTATLGCGNGPQTVKVGGANLAFDGFVARLNSSLTTLLQATYLGGSGNDVINAIAIHPVSGEVYIAGYTNSPSLPCTVASGICATGAQSVHAVDGGGADGFIARFSTNLDRLLQTTYYGGNGTDEKIEALTIHPVSGDVLITGYTNSTNLPCTSVATGCAAGSQSANAGGFDGFVARISADLTLNDNMPDAFALAAQSNVPLSSVRTSNPALISGIVGAAGIYVDGQPGSSYCVSSASGCSCNVSAGFVTAAGTITANNYVCVRHVAAAALNQLTATDLHVGGAKASFLVTTGTLVGGGPCTLDVDGNNAIDALTDGLLILRAMFGLTGTSVTNGALGGGASRSDWTTIRAYLNGSCGASFAP